VAADSPLVGRYRTEYDRIFTGRAAPARLQIIHHSLPARLKALEARAEAVWAAADALQASLEPWGADQAPSAQTTLDRITRYRVERLAFVHAVRHYNLEIMEYATAAAGDVREPATFVSMLVKRSESNPAAETLADDDKKHKRNAVESEITPTSGRSIVQDEEPALDELTDDEPAVEEPAVDDLAQFPATEETASSDSTAAEERSVLRSPPKRLNAAPSSTQPATFVTPVDQGGSAPRTFAPRTFEESEAAPIPPSVPSEAQPAGPEFPPAPAAPPNAPTGGFRRTLRPGDTGLASGVALSYRGLLGGAPSVQARALVDHWASILAQAAGTRGPTLEQALGRVQPAGRNRIVAAYWEAWTETAARAAAQERAKQLEDLSPLTLQLRNRAGGAQEAIDVQAAWLSAAADAADNEARRVEAVSRLNQLLGYAADSRSFWPASAPTTDLPAWIKDSGTLRGGHALARRFDNLSSRAARIAALDAARAELVSQYAEGAIPLADAVRAIERQYAAADAFLYAVQQANRELAEAALDDPQQSGSASSLAQRLSAPARASR
jgi:hypothetical protein